MYQLRCYVKCLFVLGDDGIVYIIAFRGRGDVYKREIYNVFAQKIDPPFFFNVFELKNTSLFFQSFFTKK